MTNFELHIALVRGGCYSEETNREFIRFFNTKQIPELQDDNTLAHFIAQLSHESEGLSDMEEDYWYSPERILAIFSKYVKKHSRAKRLSKNPEELLSVVYGGRMGNRPGTNDGWVYRGRGPLMLTGYNNYKRVGEWLGLDLVGNPDLAAEPYIGLQVAHWFFTTRKVRGENLYTWAEENEVELVTRGVNGGLNGLGHRNKLTHRILDFLDKEDGDFEVTSGSRGDDVKELQYYLSLCDEYTGRIDGISGPGTMGAASRFFAEDVDVVCAGKLDDLRNAVIH